jgi:hypothetical protein
MRNEQAFGERLEFSTRWLVNKLKVILFGAMRQWLARIPSLGDSASVYDVEVEDDLLNIAVLPMRF